MYYTILFPLRFLLKPSDTSECALKQEDHDCFVVNHYAALHQSQTHIFKLIYFREILNLVSRKLDVNQCEQKVFLCEQFVAQTRHTF